MSAKYSPDPKQRARPHVIYIERRNGKSYFSKVFRTYDEAEYARKRDMFEVSTTFNETATIPLSELPRLFGIFEGMTQTAIVKMLGGYEEPLIRKRIR